MLPSKFQEWKGLDRISLVVHEMKCIFREITKDDYGLDGEIEVVVQKAGGKGYETNGGIIKVQAKSGESYVKQDGESGFVTPVEKSDFNAGKYDEILLASVMSPPRISFDQREKLYSNLLLVKRGPGAIFMAPTDYKDYLHVRNEISGFVPLRSSGTGAVERFSQLAAELHRQRSHYDGFDAELSWRRDVEKDLSTDLS